MTRGPGEGGWCLPAAALITLTFVELLRVWLPSVIFVVGEAGATSAPTMGAFALACLAVGLLAAAALPRVPARVLWLAGVAGLVVGRLGVQVVDGGAAQAVTSTIGVVGGVVALVGLAAGAPSGQTARLGVLVGLASAVGQHAALGTYDLAWQSGLGPAAAVTILLTALVVAAGRFATDPGWGEETASAGPGWPWLVLAPALVLVGIITGVPARAAMSSGWSNGAVGAALVAAHGLAVAVAVAGARLGPDVMGTTGAALVAVGTAIALRPTGPLALTAQLGLAIGLGAVLAATASVAGSSTVRRRGLAAGGAILLFGVAAFVYYTAYDIALPFPNRAVLLVAALGLAALGLVAWYVGQTGTQTVEDRERSAVAVVAATVGLAALVWVAAPTVTTLEPARGAADAPVRVALYNLHMGFDVKGRFAVDAQAAVLAAEPPDIVVLNEVDRGWLVTGGHDTLRLFADRLGLPHVFAPAADEVWGNALLSRYPVSELRIERLPRGGAPMMRSQLVAVIDVAEGQQLAVVGTHLSHVDSQGDTRLPQARAVAGTVARLRERSLPTVVLGDLNAEPGSPELATFDPFVRTALPSTAATWPSWDPVERIDHVLISDDLVARDLSVPDSLASDHLPVVVTLELGDG